MMALLIIGFLSWWLGGAFGFNVFLGILALLFIVEALND